MKISESVSQMILKLEEDKKLENVKVLVKQLRLLAGNESKLSVLVGISRGTLRKRLTQYFGKDYRNKVFIGDLNSLHSGTKHDHLL